MFTNANATLKVQQKTMQMVLAVPSIMASRIWMISTSPINSTMQRNEITKMIEEKQNAFFTSLTEVNAQIIDSQMTLAKRWLQLSQDFMGGNLNSFSTFNTAVDRETLKVVNKGLNPYVKTVNANKKRLVN